MEWNKMVPELTVSNFEDSLNFYTRIIGFKIVHQRMNPSFAYIDLDGAQIMLEEFHKEGWNAAHLERPFGRGMNFQIEVEDLKSIHESLKNEGIELYRPMKESWYKTSKDKESGQEEFLVQDPDGYLLLFIKYIGERSIL